MSDTWHQKHLDALYALEPSARKSLGKYKPIMKHIERGLVRTEVLERAAAFNIDGNRTYARGRVFDTREEAIACAAEIKQQRIDDHIQTCARRGIQLKIS